MKHVINALAGSEEFRNRFAEIREQFLSRFDASEFDAESYFSVDVEGGIVDTFETKSDARQFIEFMFDEGMCVAICKSAVERESTTLVAHWEEPDTGPVWPPGTRPTAEYVHLGVFRVDN